MSSETNTSEDSCDEFAGYSDDGGHTDGEHHEALEELPARPLALVVMTCVIGGYTLIGPLQHKLKVRIGVSDSGLKSQVFTQSVAMVQVGKTLTTLGQNVLLCCFQTRTRVLISMCIMFVGVLIQPLIIFTLDSTWLGWVPISYFCIGIALGIFECTYLSVISPLGPATKSIAIMGFPAAFALVNIVGMTFVAFGGNIAWVFWCIALAQPLAIALFHLIAPEAEVKVEGKSFEQADIRRSLSDARDWVPKILPFCLVNIVSHFVMESVPAIFSTYNEPHYVSLLGPEDNSVLMPHTWFMVVLSTFMAVGDISARRIGYCFAFDTQNSNYAGLAFALVMIVVGMALMLMDIAWMAWLSVGISFFGAGFNYAVTAKYIDRYVPRRHNLAGYSLWMFVGYCGAISGAVTTQLTRDWMCGGHHPVYAHQCMSGHHHANASMAALSNSSVTA